jgi:mannose-6-phosphate isomerase-like protein (cupin superfamily)
VLGGEFDLTIGAETRRMKKNDAFYIPAGMHHRVKIISAPCVIIDVWPRSGPDIPE